MDGTQILTLGLGLEAPGSSRTSTWIPPYRPIGWTSTSRPSEAAITPVLSAARPVRLTISPTRPGGT